MVSLIASLVLIAVQAQASEPLVRFEEFPVSERYTGTPAAVNLSSDPEAQRFRTVLHNGAKHGPNFAGHYTVITWGCGTSCQSLAIVDAKSGAVYMTGLIAEAGAKFRIDSQLLVLNPAENIAEGYGNNPPNSLTSRYYVWENNQLVELLPPKSDRSSFSFSRGETSFTPLPLS